MYLQSVEKCRNKNFVGILYITKAIFSAITKTINFSRNILVVDLILHQAYFVFKTCMQQQHYCHHARLRKTVSNVDIRLVVSGFTNPTY